MWCDSCRYALVMLRWPCARARMADRELTMRVAQWVRRPAAEFIHPIAW